MTRCTHIIGHMVTRNEMARYLPDALAWLRGLTDAVVVMDDNSDDGTYEWLAEQGVTASRRPSSVKSFAENESAFRAAAWAHMENTLKPSSADWILCVDADEFVVSHRPQETHDILTDVIERANHDGSVTMPVHEVFGFEGDIPLLRVDGYWGEIVAHRLVRWRLGGQFHDRAQGGGSIPSGWAERSHETDDIGILHLGYARADDRYAKHARYSTTVGHNPRHVASILEPPTLVPWMS